MDLIILSTGFILFWATILFTDYLLKSCWVHPYLNFVKSIGLQIRPFYLGIYWNRFSHVPIRYANRYEKYIKFWMNLGVFTSLFLTPISIFILMQTIVNLISLKKDHSNNFGSLEPLLPGVNLPVSEIFYYVVSLLISSVFHEFGHFIAALREGIKVNGVGLSIFALLPVAYVDLSEDQIKKAAIGSKLRIFCAGVWHNLMLGLLTASLLLLNPSLLSPLYKTGEGIVVLSTQEDWNASSIHGIQPNDIITSINRQCHVNSKEDWKKCFQHLITKQEENYCVAEMFISQEEVKSIERTCCNENLNRHLCFIDLNSQQHLCLPARQLLEKFDSYCNETTKCSQGFSCIRPKIEITGFRLMEIHRKDKPSFIFWGHPYELYSAVSVINYSPRFNFLPLLSLQRWETLLRYITSFSLALALLNSVPCFIMDGKYIAKSSLEFLFGRFFAKSSMNFVQSSLSILGSILVVICVSLGFYNIILRDSLGN